MSINYIYILTVGIIFVTTCFIYGKYRCDNPKFKDPFQYKLGIGDIDGWSIIHILEFTIFGFLFPKYFYFIMGMGITWELFEFYYEYYKPNWLLGYGHCKTSDDGDRTWWYGKISDIFCNAIGFLIGSNLRYILQ